MSDTPRTKATNWSVMDMYDLAQMLELELAAMTAELKTYKDALKQPLAQSESLSLMWMNRALDAESTARAMTAERDYAVNENATLTIQLEAARKKISELVTILRNIFITMDDDEWEEAFLKHVSDAIK